MSNIAETLTAGERKRFSVTGRFVRLMNSTGIVEIRYFINGSEIARTGDIQAGYAEEFDEVFDSFIVENRSGAANAIEILYRMNSKARYDRSAGNVSVSNSAQSAKIPVFQAGVDFGASYKSSANLVANTSEQVISPGANVNGIIIHDAGFLSANAVGIPLVGLIAKNAAPANVTDGHLLLSTDSAAVVAGSFYASASLKQPIKIPAGLGVYFVATNSESAALRRVLYTIL